MLRVSSPVNLYTTWGQVACIQTSTLPQTSINKLGIRQPMLLVARKCKLLLAEKEIQKRSSCKV